MPDENDRQRLGREDNHYKIKQVRSEKEKKKIEKMYVIIHNDDAEHIDIDWNKNQYDELTSHHWIKDIEKRVVSNNTGTRTTIQ